MIPRPKDSAMRWIRVLLFCAFLYRATAVTLTTTSTAVLSIGIPIVPTALPVCPETGPVPCPQIIAVCPAECPTCYLNVTNPCCPNLGTPYCPISTVSSNNPTSSINSVSSISTTTPLGGCTSIYPCNITVGATHCPPQCQGSCVYNQTTPCCPNQKLGTCVGPTNGTSIAIVTTGSSLTSALTSTFVVGPTNSGTGQTSGVQARYGCYKGWILVGVVVVGMMQW